MLDNSFDVVVAHFRIHESDANDVEVYSATALAYDGTRIRPKKLMPDDPLRAVIDRESNWVIAEHVASRLGSPLKLRGAVRWEAASMTIQIESEMQVWQRNDTITINAS